MSNKSQSCYFIIQMLLGFKQIAVMSCFHEIQSWWSDLDSLILFVSSVVESAAGVVASAKTGAEMIEDSSK